MDSKNRLSDYSSLSVICAVDKFIKSVESMNETVMVPSRLLNVEPPESDDNVPLLLRGHQDPYNFYSILNNVKTSLVWGISDNDEAVRSVTNVADSSHWFGESCNGKATSELKKESVKGHSRKISSVSTASVSSMSEPECERMSDGGDSGVESEEPETVSEVTSALKLHLLGLQNCLSRLTETASYITEKYQEEVSA
ncbi:hypothetical protein Anas_05648 [Armadillidium nasatum]|uniref:Mid1-interacting protein 1-B n=1 Tax=Armadillidium nasatum TaxID=96803 RepID=A0A5N5SVM8_9CRUS|nr:hypothetical protein Anas_05648 [Armadillidium nasatum]